MKNKGYIKCNDYFFFDIPKEYQHCSGIYKIINDKTKYTYVGRTNDFRERYKKHFYDFTKNKNNSKIKYLRSCFDHVCFKMQMIEITNDLIQKEKYYIEKYNTVKNGLNLLKEDKELINLFNHKLDFSNDLLFNDKSLKVIQDKKKSLKNLSKNIEETIIDHDEKCKVENSFVDFKNLKVQKFLAKNNFSTNGKVFYIRVDNKLKRVKKSTFVKILIESNVLNKIYH